MSMGTLSHVMKLCKMLLMVRWACSLGRCVARSSGMAKFLFATMCLRSQVFSWVGKGLWLRYGRVRGLLCLGIVQLRK